jgi:hypothetical protein
MALIGRSAKFANVRSSTHDRQQRVDLRLTSATSARSCSAQKCAHSGRCNVVGTPPAPRRLRSVPCPLARPVSFRPDDSFNTVASLRGWCASVCDPGTPILSSCNAIRHRTQLTKGSWCGRCRANQHPISVDRQSGFTGARLALARGSTAGWASRSGTTWKTALRRARSDHRRRASATCSRGGQHQYE